MALVAKELTDSILAAFYTVHGRVEFGYWESVYKNALAVELRKRGHVVRREVSYRIYYDGELIGFFRADFLVDDTVILEIKSTETLPPHAKRQLLNYVKTAKKPVGLLLHFGPEPKFHRVVNTITK